MSVDTATPVLDAPATETAPAPKATPKPRPKLTPKAKPAKVAAKAKPKAKPAKPAKAAKATKAPRAKLDIRPGTVLKRDYLGKEYKVTVRADGFEYKGKKFKSLTAVAQEVTGYASINGRNWFGVNK